MSAPEDLWTPSDIGAHAPASGSADETQPLPISLALADYDRTRPLIDGRVRLEGLAPKITTDDIGAFCKRPVYDEFDVAEMSLSWFVAARARGEPVIGLPIFPLRMPVFAYMFCRSDAPYTEPSDLVGKRVGSMGYRYTVNLWLRGILADHYGLAPQDVTWVTGEREGAGFVVPPGIRVEVVDDRSDEELLLAGEIDAIFSPVIPSAFWRGDPRLRRLFPDAGAEQAAYFARTGVLPITHVMVTGERFIARHPWIAASLMKGFRAAQALVEADYAEPKAFSSPDAVFLIEETRRRYGDRLWTHGLEQNRHNLKTFLRYAHEQGYVDRPLSLESLFVENAAAL